MRTTRLQCLVLHHMLQQKRDFYAYSVATSLDLNEVSIRNILRVFKKEGFIKESGVKRSKMGAPRIMYAVADQYSATRYVDLCRTTYLKELEECSDRMQSLVKDLQVLSQPL